MRRIIHRISVTGLILVLAGCGGKSGGSGITGPNPGGTTGPMSAKINGTTWTADPLVAGQGALTASPGAYVITGYKLVSATNAQFLTLLLYNIKGPGTYPLGVTPQVFGGIGQFGDANGGWSSPLSGVAGTVTITTLTTTRMAGTFSFTADAIFGTATGSRDVTEGTFDFPVVTIGTVGPLPDNAGGRISATLGGTFWNGSTAQAQIMNVWGANTLIMGGLSTNASLSVTLTGITGPGTYPLNNTAPTVMLMVSDTPGGSSWGGTVSFPPGGGAPTTNDLGSVVITSLTATRVKGTFSGTLAPGFGSGAPGSLVVTGGEFDIGLP